MTNPALQYQNRLREMADRLAGVRVAVMAAKQALDQHEDKTPELKRNLREAAFRSATVEAAWRLLATCYEITEDGLPVEGHETVRAVLEGRDDEIAGE